ncbi:metal-dependent hydrolase [Zhihengliuella sp.]|uniref:metal-dependent hydrolase n=1 Tax=Zhihengliuella sp. TaxID=1954483 RepID=UPI0028124F78|nr:metal-dependent hydrolase [Zhihengliuella sp.]
MLGGNHAACGAAAWVALASSATVRLDWLQSIPVLGGSVPEAVTLGLGLFGDAPGGVATGALVCAGAALLPDADHRHATIARSLPPVTNALSAFLGRIAGGHRQGTHSLVGIAGFMVVAWIAGLWHVDVPGLGRADVGPGLCTILLASLAAKALRFIPDRLQRTPWVVGAVCGAAVALFSPEDPRWFVAATGVGVAAHILGDLLTVGGVNPLWPVRWKRPRSLHHAPVANSIWRRNGHVSVPVLGTTGSWREWVFSVPVAAYALLGTGISVATMIAAATAA